MRENACGQNDRVQKRRKDFSLGMKEGQEGGIKHVLKMSTRFLIHQQKQPRRSPNHRPVKSSDNVTTYKPERGNLKSGKADNISLGKTQRGTSESSKADNVSIAKPNEAKE